MVYLSVYSTWNRYITLQIGGKIILQKTGQKSCIKRVNNFQAQNQVIMKNFFYQPNYCKTFTSSKKLAIMLWRRILHDNFTNWIRFPPFNLCTTMRLMNTRYLLRFECHLPHLILCTTLATDKKLPLIHFHTSYQNT